MIKPSTPICNPLDLTPGKENPAAVGTCPRKKSGPSAQDDQPGAATPVYTVRGKYTARGWTEWTQGFVYGSAILQYDATGDEAFLKYGREQTVSPHGAPHHARRRARPRLQQRQHLRQPVAADERGAPPGKRMGTQFLRDRAQEFRRGAGGPLDGIANDDGGYIYSFNGPHSLFADTIRSLRALAVSHQLGHVLMGERDTKISLLGRLIEARADH